MDAETKKRIGLCDKHGFTDRIDSNGVAHYLDCPICKIERLETTNLQQTAHIDQLKTVLRIANEELKYGRMTAAHKEIIRVLKIIDSRN